MNRRHFLKGLGFLPIIGVTTKFNEPDNIPNLFDSVDITYFGFGYSCHPPILNHRDLDSLSCCFYSKDKLEKGQRFQVGNSLITGHFIGAFNGKSVNFVLEIDRIYIRDCWDGGGGNIYRYCYKVL